MGRPDDRNITWYLAGPMSGIMGQNYDAFSSACRQLRYVGFNIISPHETFHFPTQPDAPQWQKLLKHDLTSLLKCQGIILLPGWSKSKGARFELEFALTLGLEVQLFRDGMLFDIG